MILFSGSPKSTAFCADSSAESTNASFITASGGSGSGRLRLASIRRLARLWSRLPQFTPMRTALPFSAAVRIKKANFSSPFAPLPTLPGLMRYLAKAFPHSGNSARSRSPLKWKSPMSGVGQPMSSSRLRISATLAAACGLFTVIRTISEPASLSSFTCKAVASASAVSVLVIDCTTTGDSEPTVMCSIST